MIKMKDVEKLAKMRKKILDCPEVEKVVMREEKNESHVKNVIEVTITLKKAMKTNRECVHKVMGQYKRYYEEISEVWFTKVGKWNVVFIIA